MKTIHRNIDRVLWPVEREDYLFIAAGFGVGYVLIGSVWIGILTTAAAILWLRKLKKGRPKGYLLHWAYRRGGQIKGFPKGNIKRFGP